MENRINGHYLASFSCVSPFTLSLSCCMIACLQPMKAPLRSSVLIYKCIRTVYARTSLFNIILKWKVETQDYTINCLRNKIQHGWDYVTFSHVSLLTLSLAQLRSFGNSWENTHWGLLHRYSILPFPVFPVCRGAGLCVARGKWVSITFYHGL